MSGRLNIPQADWNNYSDPFILPSSAGFPANLETAHDLAEYLFFLHPEYAAASARLVSHFCTGIEWKGEVGGQGEREELEGILLNHIDLKGSWRQLGLNYSCFGNGLATLYRPFDRYLLDRRGPRTRFWELAMFRDLPGVQYDWENMSYEVPDPLMLKREGSLGREKALSNKVKFEIYDHESRDVSRLHVRHLDPRHVVLDEAMSGRMEVYDKFDPEFISQIKNNQLFQIAETPLAILRAISQNKVLRYNQGEVFHLKEPTIQGLSNRGWGISPVLRNFRAIQQLSVYRKIDEVVGREYALPFRVITPDFKAGTDETAIRMAMGAWGHQIRHMVQARRQNEQVIHTLPFPVAYQEFGATGKNLSTTDHLTFQQNTLFNALGYPAEIFNGSMQIQGLPTALRMLEANFHFLYHGFDQFSKWVTRRVQEFRQQDYIEPVLQRPQMADDIEQRQVWLQMAAGGEIPRRIAYGPFNINNPVEAAKERMREDQDIARAQQEMQEEDAQRQAVGSGTALVMSAMQGQAPGGAQMGGGGGGAPQQGNITPLRIMQDAKDKATELLNMDVGARRKALSQIEAGDPHFYAVVKQEMENGRSEAASAGRAQAGQMMAGG